MQAETEQRPHKVSFYVKKEKAQEITKALYELYEKRGVSFTLDTPIFSIAQLIMSF